METFISAKKAAISSQQAFPSTRGNEILLEKEPNGA
jgi:hypothetical protein